MLDEQLNFKDLLSLDTADETAQSKIAEYCRIDLKNLDTALERHPALYAYAVACHELAKVGEARAKWDYESAYAQASQIYLDQGTKTVTESEKKAKTAPSVVSAAKLYHAAMQVSARLKGLVEGLGHRRDMLVQIAARQRAEMHNS